jgi:hypothetical protein
MRLKILFLTCLLGASLAFVQQVRAQTQQTPPPLLFFSDLTSGPASGNSDHTYASSGGVYVTLYGNFLDNFSSIKLNGASCLTVVSSPAAWRWYERMIVMLGTTCTTGNWSITTPAGTWSGPMVSTTSGPDFTVRSGNIYYVSTTGSDSNAGTFSSPWATIPFAVQTAGKTAGNTIYAMNGVAATVDDGQGWGAALTMRDAWCQGSASAPNAFIGYPGATATIGCSPATCSGGIRGLRSTDYSADYARGFWTFAEVYFRSGGNGAVDISGGTMRQTACSAWNGGLAGCESRGWRFVGDDVSNANSAQTTAFQLSLAIQSKVYGNYLHDLVLNSTSRLDQSLYLSTDANYDEVAWNEIYNNKGRGGMQTHSSNLCWPNCAGDQTGFILHDLSIHDNMIHHINEEGILIDTVDPSMGSGIQVYNNVVYDANLDGNGDTIHFQLSGDFTQAGDTGFSPPPVWWYNNTISCNKGNGCWGAWFPDVHPATETSTNRLANNILYSTNSTIYLDPQTYLGAGCNNTDLSIACPSGSGNKNILYGNGTPTYPNLFAGSANSDPLFVSASGFNFHLQSGSPAIGAGLRTIQDVTTTKSVSAPIYDIDGRIRPNPPSIGAYEFGSGSISQSKPNPPTNLTVTVN